ncbi:MAG: NGG1p interacting factor NIF3 [Proteobacteria bacterium]|nr:NGG1p interacting factor NIF3 [Pseudomonadota bacterium]
MYKICVYVPEKSVEKVKQALFDAGAGRIGNYDSCCWQTEGIGQFRPLDGSNPAIGSQGEIEQVKEIKIELVCEDDLVESAIMAMRESHPYEEPAFDVWQLAAF